MAGGTLSVSGDAELRDFYSAVAVGEPDGTGVLPVFSVCCQLIPYRLTQRILRYVTRNQHSDSASAAHRYRRAGNWRVRREGRRMVAL